METKISYKNKILAIKQADEKEDGTRFFCVYKGFNNNHVPTYINSI